MEEGEAENAIHERSLMEGHINSYSNTEWLEDVLYTPHWRQSWITLVRG